MKNTDVKQIALFLIVLTILLPGLSATAQQTPAADRVTMYHVQRRIIRPAARAGRKSATAPLCSNAGTTFVGQIPPALPLLRPGRAAERPQRTLLLERQLASVLPGVSHRESHCPLGSRLQSRPDPLERPSDRHRPFHRRTGIFRFDADSGRQRHRHVPGCRAGGDGRCLARPPAAELAQTGSQSRHSGSRSRKGTAGLRPGRRPVSWYCDKHYYAILGGYSDSGPGGKRMFAEYLYRSPDLLRWEYLHPFIDTDP